MCINNLSFDVIGMKLKVRQNCTIQLVKSVCSQTWANDDLRITTTCQQWPPFWGPVFTFYNIIVPLNKSDHLSTTATNLGSWGWSLYTGLFVLFLLIACFKIDQKNLSIWMVKIFERHGGTLTSTSILRRRLWSVAIIPCI